MVMNRHLYSLYLQGGAAKLGATFNKDLGMFRRFLSADITEAQYRQLEREFRTGIDREVAKLLASYELRILNQAFVTLCTVLDSFYDDTYLAALNASPNTLEMEVTALYSGRGSEPPRATKDERIRELVDNFSRKSIAKKFAVFSRWGIDVQKLFTFWGSSESLQRQFASWDQHKLEEIYSSRHDVVHRDVWPIKSIDELEAICDYFQQLMFYVAHAVSENLIVPTDIGLMVWAGEKWKDFKKAK